MHSKIATKAVSVFGNELFCIQISLLISVFNNNIVTKDILTEINYNGLL